jgi:hypothetical protein
VLENRDVMSLRNTGLSSTTEVLMFIRGFSER